MRLKSIKSNARMHISFNNRMIMPINFKEVLDKDRTRRLSGDNARPLLELSSEPGIGSDPDLLKLTGWELTEVTDTGFGIRFYYKEPIEISQNETPDKIKIRFNVE